MPPKAAPQTYEAQGEVVRRLKADKAPKADINAAVDLLKQLKAQAAIDPNAGGNKAKAAIGSATPAPTPVSSATPAPTSATAGTHSAPAAKKPSNVVAAMASEEKTVSGPVVSSKTSITELLKQREKVRALKADITTSRSDIKEAVLMLKRIKIELGMDPDAGSYNAAHVQAYFGEFEEKSASSKFLPEEAFGNIAKECGNIDKALEIVSAWKKSQDFFGLRFKQREKLISAAHIFWREAVLCPFFNRCHGARLDALVASKEMGVLVVSFSAYLKARREHANKDHLHRSLRTVLSRLQNALREVGNKALEQQVIPTSFSSDAKTVLTNLEGRTNKLELQTSKVRALKADITTSRSDIKEAVVMLKRIKIGLGMDPDAGSCCVRYRRTCIDTGRSSPPLSLRTSASTGCAGLDQAMQAVSEWQVNKEVAALHPMKREILLLAAEALSAEVVAGGRKYSCWVLKVITSKEMSALIVHQYALQRARVRHNDMWSIWSRHFKVVRERVLSALKSVVAVANEVIPPDKPLAPVDLMFLRCQAVAETVNSIHLRMQVHNCTRADELAYELTQRANVLCVKVRNANQSNKVAIVVEAEKLLQSTLKVEIAMLTEQSALYWAQQACLAAERATVASRDTQDLQCRQEVAKARAAVENAERWAKTASEAAAATSVAYHSIIRQEVNDNIKCLTQKASDVMTAYAVSLARHAAPESIKVVSQALVMIQGRPPITKIAELYEFIAHTVQVSNGRSAMITAATRAKNITLKFELCTSTCSCVRCRMPISDLTMALFRQYCQMAESADCSFDSLLEMVSAPGVVKRKELLQVAQKHASSASLILNWIIEQTYNSSNHHIHEQKFESQVSEIKMASNYQKNRKGKSDQELFDMLYQNAQDVEPSFHDMVQNICCRGQHERGNLKAKSRCLEKLADYANVQPQPACLHIKDILRDTIVFKDIEEMMECLDVLKKHRQLTITSIKNRLKQDTHDVLLNVRFLDHIAEIQFHLEEIYPLKKSAHYLYSITRVKLPDELIQGTTLSIKRHIF